MIRRTLAAPLVALVPLAAIAGCSLLDGPKVPPTHFFVLTAAAPPAATTHEVAIGLGPVTLPSYLDRPQMARRVDQNQIAYDDTARWAEPLSQNVTRTLAANLVLLIGPRALLLFPWYSTATFDYVVTIDFSRFEEQPDGAMMAAGRWTLSRHQDAGRLVQTFVLSRPGGAADENAAVLSALLGDLSAEIAAAIQAGRTAP